MERIERIIRKMTHQRKTAVFVAAVLIFALILASLLPALSEKGCIYASESGSENFDGEQNAADTTDEAGGDPDGAQTAADTSDEAGGDPDGAQTAVDTSEQAEEFSGSRALSFSAVPSDLENFVNGGRTALDLILRKSSPEWLDYSFTSDDGAMVLTISFSFDSLDDYREKLEALLGSEPSVVYLNEEVLFLMEGHGAYDLLSYIEKELLELDCLSEKALSEIFTLSENAMTLNGETYSFEDRVEIRENGTKIIRADVIFIDTVMDKNGKYTRTVTACLDQGTALDTQIEALKEQFEVVSGKVELTEEDGFTKISVSFSAAAVEDLAADTMLCLNVADSLTETVAYEDEDTVLVSVTEFLDADGILKDGGTLSYSMAFPSYVSDVETENGSGAVAERTVTVEYVADTDAEGADGETADAGDTDGDTADAGTGTAGNMDTGLSVSISYHRAPNFSRLTEDTDFGSVLGKITRTITFEMPLELAEYYHESLKEDMTERLIQGVTLDIYDQEDVRCYRFTFSAWFLKDVQEFTKAILGKDNDLGYEDSWIPFAGGEISDSISVEGVAKNMSPTEEIVLTYTVSNLRNVSEITRGADSAVVDGHTVSFTVSDGDWVSFEYTGLNLVRGCLLLLACLLVLAVFLRVIAVIRKAVKKRRSGNGEG